MLLNCGVREDSESPLDCKEIQPVHPKGNQSWIFSGRTDAEAETPILWPPDAKNWLLGKRPWCWERLKAGGEGDDRGWDGWMASPTGWTWVWVNSLSWWWIGRAAVHGVTKSQTRLNDWTELSYSEIVWCPATLLDPFTSDNNFVFCVCLFFCLFVCLV